MILMNHWFYFNESIYFKCTITILSVQYPHTVCIQTFFFVLTISLFSYHPKKKKNYFTFLEISEGPICYRPEPSLRRSIIQLKVACLRSFLSSSGTNSSEYGTWTKAEKNLSATASPVISVAFISLAFFFFFSFNRKKFFLVA